MTEGNVIIVHGSNSDEKSANYGGGENTRHWHPWLKQKLKENEIEVSGELYPKDWNPDYNDWGKVFEKNEINENSILIGHSSGCAFLLRWLSENKKKIKKLILVAPYLLDVPEYPSFSSLLKFNIDENIKNYFNDLIIFYSGNDDKDIIESAKFVNEKLGGKLRQIENNGHFTLGDMRTEEFPELLSEIL